MQISLVSFTQLNKEKNYRLLLKVSSLPTCLALQHCTALGLHWKEFAFMWRLIIQLPYHHQHLYLCLLFPPPLLVFSFFTSCLSPPFTPIPLTTRCSSVVLSAAKQRDKRSRAQLLFPGSVSSPGASGPNCDSWTSGAEWPEWPERPTLKPSQGADACFLLTYAPPRWGRTDGKWGGGLEGRGGGRSEGKPGYCRRKRK